MQSSEISGIKRLLKLKNTIWFSSSILVFPDLKDSILLDIKFVIIPIKDEKTKMPKIVMLNLMNQ